MVLCCKDLSAIIILMEGKRWCSDDDDVKKFPDEAGCSFRGSPQTTTMCMSILILIANFL